MNHPCDGQTDGRTDGRNCDSICALSIFAVARKKEDRMDRCRDCNKLVLDKDAATE